MKALIFSAVEDVVPIPSPRFAGLGELRQEKGAPARFKTLERILDWDFDQIIVGHGSVVENNGKEVFRTAFRWLFK